MSEEFLLEECTTAAGRPRPAETCRAAAQSVAGQPLDRGMWKGLSGAQLLIGGVPMGSSSLAPTITTEHTGYRSTRQSAVEAIARTRIGSVAARAACP